ncbi:GNAT family N-acetyltransferase [archaeon]|nr:GNAT family N-acetyltransferase [Nanoarchaeota archaeon]MBU4300194.1 GNAT family N-acetyltransferase [Nanoarchaeota archaeon]MBU4452068.1 GNAT family N-acetyltransferase [Nanoarchaeota archaeon]MCG2724449.1 GNAT family N-acetyltransferase [archaeon]
MNVVKINEKDVQALSRLAKQIIFESPYYSDLAKRECMHDFLIKKIKTDLKDKTVLLLAAKTDGKMVGFIRGYFEGGIASGIFWFQWICIDTAFQRNGIANKMLNYLTKKVKLAYGTHKIVCVIRPENEASISLFKKNKYQKLTTLKKHWYKEEFLLWYKDI